MRSAELGKECGAGGRGDDQMRSEAERVGKGTIGSDEECERAVGGRRWKRAVAVAA